VNAIRSLQRKCGGDPILNAAFDEVVVWALRSRIAEVELVLLKLSKSEDNKKIQDATRDYLNSRAIFRGEAVRLRKLCRPLNIDVPPLARDEVCNAFA